jgi:hypothetical protein
MTARPGSLHEVARRVARGEQAFGPALPEFLDSFYSKPEQREGAISQQPQALDALRDAYIAAVAEHLPRSFRLEIPDWAEKQGLDLARPFFAGNLESLKARLMVESPTAFRPRMLFVSKNVLSRPRDVASDP